jgi:uncharacterized protein with HEPN domain
MKKINFTFDERGEIKIQDFPTAKKVVLLKGDKAQELSDIDLCSLDLNHAANCVLLAEDSKRDSFERSMFFNMAIISFLKPFGENKGRVHQLNIDEILKGNEMGKVAYKFIKDLRNKHIAHDENAVSQSIPAAIINKEGSSPKVAQIFTLSFRGVVHDKANLANLRELIAQTQGHIITRYDKLCEEIGAGLEQKNHNELLKMEQVVFTPPAAKEITGNRRKI